MADLRVLLERVREARAHHAEHVGTDRGANAWADVMDAQHALATALLASPSVLDAYEAVRQVGAIVGRCSCRDGIQCDVCGETDRQATDMVLAVRRALKLADRLAKGTDR